MDDYLNFIAGEYIRDIIQSNISSGLASIGATPVGPQKVSLLQNLPLLSFGGATFAYKSLVAKSDGMVLGGPVSGIISPSTDIVNFQVAQFTNAFNVAGDCNAGKPVQPPKLGEVWISAGASYSEAGKLCSVDIISPTGGSTDPSPYLNKSPDVGSITSYGEILFAFPGTVAALFASSGQPFEVLVRTARGVRILNFGLPPLPQIDKSGNLVNYKVIWIIPCPVAVDPWYQYFHLYNPAWTPDPPHDGWRDNLVDVAAFGISLISVGGVQNSEMVTLNQPVDGGLSVFAGGVGERVVVPAAFAVRSFSEAAVLSKTNRSALGQLGVRTMLFERVAVLNTPGARSHQLSGEGQRAVIVTTYAGRTETTEIGALGIRQSVVEQISSGGANRDLTAPQGVRAAPGKPIGGWTIDLPGLVAVHPIPGFEQAPIAIAELSDGTSRALARDQDGSVQVTGFLPRWPNMPPVSGSWAISAASGDRIAVFTVRSMTPASCCKTQIA